MESINNQENPDFVLPHQAEALKELGFDKPCFMFYYNDGCGLTDDTIFKTSMDSNPCNAPLYQQAFDYFRNLKDWPIESWIQPFLSLAPRKHEAKFWTRGETMSAGIFDSYMDAKNALLDKLIELEIIKRLLK